MLIAAQFRQWIRHATQRRRTRRRQARERASSFIARHKLGYPELLEDRTLLTSAISFLDGTLTIDIGADGEQATLTVAGGSDLSITSSDVGGTIADAAAQALGFAAMTAANTSSTGNISGGTPVTQIVINGAAGAQTILLGDGAFPALTAGESSDVELISVTGDVTLGSNDLNLLATLTVAAATGSSITTVDGNVTLQGNIGETSNVDSIGISLSNATISTSGTGDITLTGRGGVGTVAEKNGVNVASGSQIESTATGADAGKITIAGFGGNAPNFSSGVVFRDAGTALSTVDGAISVTGVGATGTLEANHGVQFIGGATASSTGTGSLAGTITLTGTGGSGTSSNQGVNVHSTSSAITSIDGNIVIAGQGGAGTGSANIGVFIFSNASVESTGTTADAATITISGTGRSGTSSNVGVAVNSANARVESAHGRISITGQGGTATGDGNHGVLLFDSGAVRSTGLATAPGPVTVTGTGGTGTDFSHGVLLLGTNTTISSVNADISVTATGGQTPGGRNRGVWLVDGGIIESTGTTSDAATVTIQGTGGGSAGQNNFGVMIGTGVSGIKSFTGDILVEGTGGNGTTEFNHGVAVSGDGFVESTGSGSDAASIVIRGTGGTGPQNNFGVGIGSPGGRVTSNAGTIQIDGSGGLDGGKLNRGIALFGGTIQSTNSSVALLANNYFRADSVSQIDSALGTTLDVDGDDEDPEIEADVFIEGAITSATQTTITTGSENDTLVLGLTNDSDAVVINTGSGNDTVDSSGSDVPITINGGDGNDSLTGSAFDDVLNGEEGNDTLLGLGGLDRLTGGTGTDSFENVARPLIVDTTTDVDDGDYSAGKLSLREAVRLANESVDLDETISFDAAINGSTITLTGGELPILNPVVINGPGTELLTIDADDLSRVFNVDDENSETQIAVSITGLTLTQGMTTGNGGAIVNSENLSLNNVTISNSSAVKGGGVFNTGILNVTDSTVSGNTASVGGAIVNAQATLYVTASTIADNVGTAQGAGIVVAGATAVISDSALLHNTGSGEGGGITSYQSNLTVQNSTLFGNETRGDGGGIFIGSGGTAHVVQSTISGNRSGVNNSGVDFIFGGGIRKRSGSLTLQNTIVAGNFRGTGTTTDDVTGTVDTGTFNLIGDAASSGGLADGVSGNIVGDQGVGVLDLTGVLAPTPMDHGGPTVTFALPLGSLAIDAGDNTQAPSINDQRGAGFDRIIDGDYDDTATVDIGSFEFTPPPPDFGDAPDSAGGTSGGDYQTTSADNGPRHNIVAGLRLGASVDGDDGMLQNVTANADDVGGALPDDEDGVLSPLQLRGTISAAPTVTLLVTNTTDSSATLAGWIDYNQDGVFDNATERAQAAIPNGTTDGRFTLRFPTIPEGAFGTTYARFRLSTDALFVVNPSSTGEASDGEVEDYVFAIMNPSQTPVDNSKSVRITSDTNGGPTLADVNFFGVSVASLGDFDGDGVADLAVGAVGDDTGGTDRGAVYLQLMNADGTAKSSTKIASVTNGGPALADLDYFGSSVTSLGDLDGDGITDLAVGAEQDDTGGDSRGAVHVLLLNADGTVKNSTKIASDTAGGPALLDNGRFGRSLSSAGDLDGDGIADLAVGADQSNTTYVLFLNSDGSVKRTTNITHQINGGPVLGALDRFGSSVTSLGDLDGDGINDLAVGAFGDEAGGGTFSNRGAVYVLLMNADGTVKSSTKIAHELNGGPTLADGDRFGSAVTSMGDLDGDGVNDVAVGAVGDDTGGSYRGAIHVLLLNADGTAKSSTKIAHETNGGPTLADEDRFGFAAAFTGDLDGDGAIELVVGAHIDSTAGPVRGAVHVLFLETFDPTPVVTLPAGGGTYEVLTVDTDLAIRIAGGAELFRQSTASITVLEIKGSAGADLITILNGGGTVATPILFSGEGGDDLFDASLATGPTTLGGGAGNDTLTGGADNDLIIGGRGKDIVSGNAGNDRIDGRSGRDTLTGGAGNDTIRGGRGQDSIEGNQEADVLIGGGSRDTISGGNGNDRIVGGPGRDLIDGDDGDDTLHGGPGADNLAGGMGSDTLNGVFRDDSFNQVVGPDTLIGGQRPSGRPALPLPLVSGLASGLQESSALLTSPNPETSDRQGTGQENAAGKFPQLDKVFVDSLIPELLDSR